MRSPRFASLLVIFITVWFTNAVLSQLTPKAPQKTEPKIEDQVRKDTIKEVRVSVNFPGGTLHSYVTHLKNNNRGANVNVIADKAIRDLDLPDFTLKDAPLSDAVGWIPGVTAASRRAVTVQPLSRGYRRLDGGFFISGQPEPKSSDSSHPPESARKQDLPKPERQFRAYSLRGLTGQGATTTDDPVLVEKTVKEYFVKPKTEGFDAQYKKTTGLLVVYGTPSEQTLTSQLIEEMTQARRQATAATQLKSEMDALKAQVKRLEGELADMKKPKEK